MRATGLALALLLSSTSAFADPVRVVIDGVLGSGGDDGWEHNGFFLQGSDFWFGAGSEIGPVVTCDPCTPGTLLDLSSTVNLRDWPAGEARIDGRTYESVFFDGVLNFTAGPIVVPEPTSDLSVALATFTFTGTLAGFADASRTGTPLFSTDLSGGGSRHTATLVIFARGFPDTRYFLNQIDYRFDNVAPTPEPGSLLLFGSGAAWVATRWRKRRQDFAAFDSGRRDFDRH